MTMRRLSSRVLLSFALCGSALVSPATVLAQPAAEAAAEPAAQPADKKLTDEELAAARQLFTDALELEKKTEWGAALGKLERLSKIKMTPQVRFHIALCHENLGRLVEAINGFELAAQEASRAGDKAIAVAENAPRRAEALRGRVGYVELTLSGRRNVSEITLDGRPLSDALFGTAIPVNPGKHLIEVRRDGEVTWQKSLEVAKAERAAIEIEVNDPEVVPQPIVPEPGGGSGAGGGAAEGEGESKRIPAYLVGGVGVASLAAAGVLWGLRESTLSNVANNCQSPQTFDGCDPDDENTANLALRYDIASKVTLGVGAAALATGVVLFFVLAPEDAEPAPVDGQDSDETEEPQVTLSVVPVATPNYGGIGFYGTF